MISADIGHSAVVSGGGRCPGRHLVASEPAWAGLDGDVAWTAREDRRSDVLNSNGGVASRDEAINVGDGQRDIVRAAIGTSEATGTDRARGDAAIVGATVIDIGPGDVGHAGIVEV